MNARNFNSNRNYQLRSGHRKALAAIFACLVAVMELAGCESICDIGISPACTEVDTTPPGPVSPFDATPGDRQVTLNWGNPVDQDYEGVIIQRGTEDFPESINEGDRVTCVGRDTIFYVDSGLTRGTTYYYSAFSKDTSGNIQPSTDNQPAQVSVTLQPNQIPLADAGDNQEVAVGATVTLDGSGSSDPDGDPLTYGWTLDVPEGSTAELSDSAAVQPTFVADVLGEYTATLVVNDGEANSTPGSEAAIIVSRINTPPTADAGNDQSVMVGATVTLDGSGSSDPDGNPLTYAWTLFEAPDDSIAELSDNTAIQPTFVTDIAGDYTLTLVVSDGELESQADTSTITAQLNQPPTANAGDDQYTIEVGATVTLDGSGSSDPDGDNLTYSWTLETTPEDSTAELSDSTAIQPTFVADIAGEYTATLVVSDGKAISDSDSVTIAAGSEAFAIVAIEPDSESTLLATGEIKFTFSSPASPDSLSLSGSMTGSGQIDVNNGGVSWTEDNTVLTLTAVSAWEEGCSKTLSLSVSGANGASSTQQDLEYGVGDIGVSFGNIVNNGVIESGFIIGSATGCTSVDVSFDAGEYQSADLTDSSDWAIQLPTGSNSWRDGSQHSVSVRALSGNEASETVIVSVRKGTNYDINGDGYGDVVASAYRYNLSTGRAYIFYSSGEQGISQTSATLADNTITGEEVGSRFGVCIAQGDLDGDGYSDLAISAIRHDNVTGRAYIFYSNGTDGISSSSAADADLRISGENESDGFGCDLAIGDVNSDGFSDLIAGSTGYPSAGRVYVFYSAGITGILATVAASADAIISGQSGGCLGLAMGLGDVDANGTLDLAVGDSCFSNSTGRVYVLRSDPSTGIETTQVASASSTITGEQESDRFGFALDMGDVDGDGYVDLVVGANGHSTDTGTVYVFRSYLGEFNSDAIFAESTISGAVLSHFGDSVVVGDINGDGNDDIISEAHTYASALGGVFIFNSNGDSEEFASSIGSADSGIFGEESNTYFGDFIGLRDVNGDGNPDLVAGAPVYSNETGRLYIIHSAALIGSTVDVDDQANSIVDGEVSQSYFGCIGTCF